MDFLVFHEKKIIFNSLVVLLLAESLPKKDLPFENKIYRFSKEDINMLRVRVVIRKLRVRHPSGR